MMIGVDLAKSGFQVHGTLRTGAVQFRKKLTRQQFTAFMARQIWAMPTKSEDYKDPALAVAA
jgi:hypothetical protein